MAGHLGVGLPATPPLPMSNTGQNSSQAILNQCTCQMQGAEEIMSRFQVTYSAPQLPRGCDAADHSKCFRSCSVQPAQLLEYFKGTLKLFTLREDVAQERPRTSFGYSRIVRMMKVFLTSYPSPSGTFSMTSKQSRPSPCLIDAVRIGTLLLDASSVPLLSPQCTVNWNRKFRNPLASPSKLASFPMLSRSIARASVCLAPNSAARVSAAIAADSAWCCCCSRSQIRCAALETTTNSEILNKRPSSTTLLRHNVRCDPLCDGHLCVFSRRLETKRPNVAYVRCESFRIFVMCLHGLDILSMWVLFFSLLCATASAFQYSHLAKDLEVFVTNCMDKPRSCSARVDEMRVFEIVCILCADHVF